MTQEPNATNGRPRRWVRVLLVVSLALNLLVLGMVGGAMLALPKWKGHHPPRLDMVGGPLTRALDPEDRRAIGRKMRQAYRSSGAPLADLQAELDALVLDLSAEPFDRAAAAARLARHRSLVEDRLETGQTLLLDHLAGMTPEARAAYAGRLRDVLEKSGKRQHRDQKKAD